MQFKHCQAVPSRQSDSVFRRKLDLRQQFSRHVDARLPQMLHGDGDGAATASKAWVHAARMTRSGRHLHRRLQDARWIGAG